MINLFKRGENMAKNKDDLAVNLALSELTDLKKSIGDMDKEIAHLEEDIEDIRKYRTRISDLEKRLNTYSNVLDKMQASIENLQTECLQRHENNNKSKATGVTFVDDNGEIKLKDGKIGQIEQREQHQCIYCYKKWWTE
jgi:chromosome segregation ATPase